MLVGNKADHWSLLLLISCFSLYQGELCENLARDWFATVTLLDADGAQTNFSASSMTAQFIDGFATFEDIFFVETGKDYYLEFTVDGEWDLVIFTLASYNGDWIWLSGFIHGVLITYIFRYILGSFAKYNIWREEASWTA